MDDGPERVTEGKLLRLQCPFCGAEFPLWFRPEDEPTSSADFTAEWEAWLDRACRDCGKTPREHVRK